MNTVVAVGLLLIKHGIFTVCRRSCCLHQFSVVCTSIVHSVNNLCMFGVYTKL